MDNIEKAKIYLQPGETPPSGVVVQQGSKGGKYYESQEQPSKTVVAPEQKPKREYVTTPSGAKVPPAWSNVWIAKSPKARVQATGIDSKGRKVFIYSADFVGQRKAAKFFRLKSFSKMYPNLVNRIIQDKDNSEPAAILYLISVTGFRIGSNKDTLAKTKAFGASTLKGSHVKVKGNAVDFDFIGKKGVQITKTINNPWLANKFRETMPNENLFKSTDYEVRKYLASIPGGEKFTVKDFRTYIATQTALNEAKKQPKPDSVKAFKKFRNAIGDAVAKVLGNTRSIALNSYIAPEVFASYDAIFPGVIKKEDSLSDLFETIFYDREIPQEVIDYVEGFDDENDEEEEGAYVEKYD
jgi:DNA topoisomerase I